MSYRFDESKLRPVRFSELISYFNAMGRSTKCPVCPHDGQWHFHAQGSDTPTDDPILIPISLATAPGAPPELANKFMSVLAMECPRCGHLEMLQTARVLQYIEGKAKDAASE